jgi:hypothetical protein
MTGMFDWLKTSYAQRTGQEEAGMLPSIACGVLSSFTGQMVAFPLESIARRLQVNPYPEKANKFTVVADTLLFAG